MALRIEAALTLLYLAVFLALLWAGDRQLLNPVTGAFFAGMSTWKLWRRGRGERREPAWALWGMLACALVLLAVSHPWRA